MKSKLLISCFAFMLGSSFTLGLKPVNAQINSEIQNNHCKDNQAHEDHSNHIKHSGHDHSRCRK